MLMETSLIHTDMKLKLTESARISSNEKAESNQRSVRLL